MSFETQIIDFISDGVVTNWKDMNQIWDKSLTKLMEVEPKEHPFLLTESSCTDKKQREKSIEVRVCNAYVIKIARIFKLVR